MARAEPVFFYDLGEPECYLVAERIMSELHAVPEWEPILAAGLAVGGTAAPGSPGPPGRDRASVERRAEALGLQSWRWPEPWPPQTQTAMLAATYAKQIGRAVAFSLAAFRQAFAGGRDLGDESTVLIAAAACEMHPTAVLKGIGLRSVTGALEGANERARLAGVRSLPAIAVADELFDGEQCIEQANAALAVAL